MSLIRWQPFSEVDTLRRQMDKMFDDIVGVQSYDDTSWRPAVELIDSEQNLTLRAEIPGLEGKDLDISVTRDSVTLQGEHRHTEKTEEKGFYRSEFRYGRFERTVSLPVAVQNDKVNAEFNNGILTLTLPKVEEAQNRVIKVDVS